MPTDDHPAPEIEAARAAVAGDPASADLQMRLAVELVGHRDPAAAEAIVRATELAPEDPAILTRAAILTFDNGDLPAAKELVHRAYAHAEPGFRGVDWLMFVLGRVLLAEGNVDDARALLQGSFDGEPGNRYFGEVLARHLLASGSYDEAHAVAGQALAAGSDHPALPGLLEQIEAIRTAARSLADADGPGDAPRRATAAFNLGLLLGPVDPDGARRSYEIALGADDETLRAAAAFNLAGLLHTSDAVQARALLEVALQSPDAEIRAAASAQLGHLGEPS